MKNIKFESKLKILGLTPFIIVFVIAAFYSVFSYMNFLNSKQNFKKVNFILGASTLIESIQTERGISNRYLKGKTALGELKEQRIDSDLKMETLITSAKSLRDRNVPRSDIMEVFENFKSFREEVYSQVLSNEQAFEAYNKIIKKLQGFQGVYVTELMTSNLEEKISSLKGLELASESFAKLRDIMAMNLTKNMPLTSLTLSELIKLKSSVNTFLDSTTTNLSPETKNHITDFFLSVEWKEIDEIFIKMVKKAEQGNFNIDSQKFYNNIYVASNYLNKALSAQRSELNNYSKNFEFSYRTWFLKVVASIFSLLTLIGFFMKNTYRAILYDYRQLFKRVRHEREENEETSSHEKLAPVRSINTKKSRDVA